MYSIDKLLAAEPHGVIIALDATWRWCGLAIQPRIAARMHAELSLGMLLTPATHITYACHDFDRSSYIPAGLEISPRRYLPTPGTYRYQPALTNCLISGKLLYPSSQQPIHRQPINIFPVMLANIFCRDVVLTLKR